MSDAKRHDLSGARVYLGLGSNIGARESNVLRAIGVIDKEIAPVSAASSLYRTAPVGCRPMDDFVNAVIEVQSLLYPGDLLKRLQALERRFGRLSGHNEPRTLDIDVIALSDIVIGSSALTVPHPRYRERLFVLVPLREIAPGFRCPVTGEGIEAMVEALSHRQAITRVSSRRTMAKSADPSDRLLYVHSHQREDHA